MYGILHVFFTLLQGFYAGFEGLDLSDEFSLYFSELMLLDFRRRWLIGINVGGLLCS
jgi:hypothetical protein